MLARIISVSLSEDLPPLLDAEAARQRRSRSFIVAEAVREYLAVRDREAFERAREQTLREGLALSPSGRAQLADSLWSEYLPDQSMIRPRAWVFRRFDEYDAWKRGTAGEL